MFSTSGTFKGKHSATATWSWRQMTHSDDTLCSKSSMFKRGTLSQCAYHVCLLMSCCKIETCLSQKQCQQRSSTSARRRCYSAKQDDMSSCLEQTSRNANQALFCAPTGTSCPHEVFDKGAKMNYFIFSMQTTARSYQTLLCEGSHTSLKIIIALLAHA